jgi:phospholipase C
VYNKLHLDRLPCRYTVEAGKILTDDWLLHADGGRYDLWVYGPNGSIHEFRDLSTNRMHTIPEVDLDYDVANRSIRLTMTNHGHEEGALVVRANTYPTDGPWRIHIPYGRRIARDW